MSDPETGHSVEVVEITAPTSAVVEISGGTGLVEVSAAVAVLTALPAAGSGGVVEVAGAPGPGGSGTAYTHTQTVPATVWTITHELGYDPAGVLVLSDGYLMDDFGVQYLVPGTSLRLSFDISLAGVAYLS